MLTRYARKSTRRTTVAAPLLLEDDDAYETEEARLALIKSYRMDLRVVTRRAAKIREKHFAAFAAHWARAPTEGVHRLADESCPKEEHCHGWSGDVDVRMLALRTFVRAACIFDVWQALPQCLRLLHAELSVVVLERDDSGGAVAAGRAFLRAALPFLSALAPTRAEGEACAAALWSTCGFVSAAEPAAALEALLRDAGLVPAAGARSHGMRAMGRAPLRDGFVPLPEHYAAILKQLSPDSAAREFQCPAMCLTCGEVIAAGHTSEQVQSGAAFLTPGKCTQHIIEKHGGVGAILLMKRSAVVLIRDGWSATCVCFIVGVASVTLLTCLDRPFRLTPAFARPCNALPPHTHAHSTPRRVTVGCRATRRRTLTSGARRTMDLSAAARSRWSPHATPR